jgi:hypothetical protein
VNPEFIIRTQSNFANNFGLGEKVAENVYLFRANEYNLSRTEAEALLNRKSKLSKVKV